MSESQKWFVLAGVTFGATPNLTSGFKIPPKGHDAARRENRSRDAEARLWMGMKDAMCLPGKPARLRGQAAPRS